MKNKNEILSDILTKYGQSINPNISKVVVDSWDFKDVYKNPTDIGLGHPDYKIQTKKPELNTSGVIYLKRPVGNKDRRLVNTYSNLKELYGENIFKDLETLFYRNPYLKSIGYNVSKETNTDPQSLSKVYYNLVFDDK